MAHIEPILSASGIEPDRQGRDGHRQGRPARHRQEPLHHDAARRGLRGRSTSASTPRPTTSSTRSRSTGPSVLGMSALLTTTMPNMGQTIEAFIDADLRDDVKIMVGGAPVTQEFADDMGADGYGKDAVACVTLAKSLIAEGRLLVPDDRARRGHGSSPSAPADRSGGVQRRFDRMPEIFSSMMETVDDLARGAARTRTATTTAPPSSAAATSASRRAASCGSAAATTRSTTAARGRRPEPSGSAAVRHHRGEHPRDAGHQPVGRTSSPTGQGSGSSSGMRLGPSAGCLSPNATR